VFVLSFSSGALRVEGRVYRHLDGELVPLLLLLLLNHYYYYYYYYYCTTGYLGRQVSSGVPGAVGSVVMDQL